MGFEELHIQDDYKSSRDDVVNEFFIPVLSSTKLYKRAVGFFSSSALYEISRGLSKLADNGGKMRLIVSPRLSIEDIEAIKEGYELREIVSNSMIREFVRPTNEFDSERLNLLSHLIAQNVLDVKVAYTLSKTDISIYHEKFGVMRDFSDNIISFYGSMNDSYNAYYNNYESFDVFSNLNDENKRALKKEKYFDEIWGNTDNDLNVIEFPKNVFDLISEYKRDVFDQEIDSKQYMIKSPVTKKLLPDIPKDIELRDYQIQAINSWRENNYIGIFDMATGTGKTFTALASIISLLKKKNYKLGIVICCPYQHLVNQWVEDLREFNFEPIIGFSSSPMKKWKELLKEAVHNYKYGITDNFCLICVNDTFRGAFVQGQLNKIDRELLLVVDEAHNFGQPKLLSTLDSRFEYRLALSATFERHNDEEGTSKLFDYFGSKCIEYTLDEAIGKSLVNYYYYPIKVHLTEDEQLDYQELSKKIAKALKKDKNGKLILTYEAQMLLIRRARIVAGARNKIAELSKIMVEYEDKHNMLIYCGSTKNVHVDEDTGQIEELKQIEEVTKMLDKDHGIIATTYTSENDAEERELIKKVFIKGTTTQALVAIRCLDEGVNIPGIETAFILASSTNPKEYIQRRGRVLRKSKGKKFATIYDFVTLPNEFSENVESDQGLVMRELKRVEEFGRLSMNSRVSDQFISDLSDIYNVRISEGEEENVI